MDDKFSPREIQQIRKELAEGGVTAKNPDVLELLAHWKAHSPAMVKRLEEQKILTEYAMVTRDRFNRAVSELTSNSGMMTSEAELYLEGMLLLDKEEPEPMDSLEMDDQETDSLEMDEE